MAYIKQDNTSELKNMLRDGKSSGTFIFYGEEEYTKQYYAALLQKTHISSTNSEFAKTVFDEYNFDIDSFNDELQNISFTAESKFILLRNIDADLLSETDRKALFSALEEEYEGICILLYYDAMFSTEGEYDRLKRKNKMITNMSKRGFAVEFKKLAPAQLINWGKKCFESYGLNVSLDIIKYLISVCGTDMFNLKNEISKVAMYSDGEITKDSVDRIVTKSTEYNVFNIADDLAAGRIRSALTALEMCREAKERPDFILKRISDTFSELMAVSALKEKVPRAEIAQSIGMAQNRAWLVDRYLRICAGKTTDYFIKANLAFAECEGKLKGRGIDEWQAIETAMIKAAG